MINKTKVVRLSLATFRTIEEFGIEECRSALRRNEDDGEGANTIGSEYATPDARNCECTRIGDRMINAGREWAKAEGAVS